MRTLTRPFLLAATATCGLLVQAQQEVMVSQYMFNGLFLNPAYAGSHPYVSGSVLHREQWTNMPGAPSTSMLAVDGPLWNNRMGLGLSIVHDRIGVSRDLDISGHYAYSIRTGETSRLAFGLRAGLSVYSANMGELVYWDANDDVYQQRIKNAMVGKFGFGVFWHDELTYVGLSVPTIYAADGQVSAAAASALDHYFTQHFYLHAGRVFHLNENFDLKPSVLVKYQPDAPPQVDLNCNVLFRDRLWLGAGYRTGDAFVGMLEYQITPMFRVGYAYDMTTSMLRRFNGGSHEVMLGIDLGKDPVRIKSPRYF
ncbi:MAG: type IX secretion system membrane protein PorP/SprF [Flavobacteriales bacterium]|nr:type IX secretion system membrane protein PorP/SprF [Flavobacteriales bacterium]